MALVLRRDETTGDGRTVWPEKDEREREKARGPALIDARKPSEPPHDLAFTASLRKPGKIQALASSTPVPPPAAAAAAAAYRRRPRETPVAMSDPGRRWPPRSVAEVLETGRLPNSFFGDLSARFRMTGLDGAPLSTDLRKGGGLHVFLGRLTAEAAVVPGLADLTLLGVDQDGGANILHSLFSVPVGPYV